MSATNEFGDVLASLCSREMIRSKGDAGRIAEMVERLAHCVAFTIAIGSNGDDAVAAKLLAGVEAYLYDNSTGLMPVSKAMKDAP